MTSLDNRCGDHMMVASFPTGIAAEQADWESPFEIRRRDVDKFTNENGKKGPELERQAMQNFLHLSDDTASFSLFTKGLKEVGTTSDRGAVINLTLFRATTNTFPIHNDLLIGFENETSQCYGKQRFEYAVYVGKPEMTMAQVIAESRKYITPPIAAELGAGTGGQLAQELSFLKKENDRVVISCLKRCEKDEKALILRLYNPTDSVQQERLTLDKPIHSAMLTDMKEEPVETLSANGTQLSVQLNAYQIVTLRLEIEA